MIFMRLKNHGFQENTTFIFSIYTSLYLVYLVYILIFSIVLSNMPAGAQPRIWWPAHSWKG